MTHHLALIRINANTGTVSLLGDDWTPITFADGSPGHVAFWDAAMPDTDADLEDGAR